MVGPLGIPHFHFHQETRTVPSQEDWSGVWRTGPELSTGDGPFSRVDTSLEGRRRVCWVWEPSVRVLSVTSLRPSTVAHRSGLLSWFSFYRRSSCLRFSVRRVPGRALTEPGVTGW